MSPHTEIALSLKQSQQKPLRTSGGGEGGRGVLLLAGVSIAGGWGWGEQGFSRQRKLKRNTDKMLDNLDKKHKTAQIEAL